ncbi:MAG TPA: type IV pilus assembly protein PilM [Candidatus Paceibacterota bacterium]|nr:type IV pilus assembly protein PilM [Candidatus Paceibacterota bacterium]
MAFSFGKLLQGMRSTDGSVVGVDIGSSSIKVVQLRASRGIAILETYGEIALGPYASNAIGKTVRLPAEKLAEALLDLMREANVTAHEASVSIPFSSSLLTVIDLPKVDAESLKRIVPLEARKYIPVPVSDVVLDWFVIPPEENETSAFDKVTDPKKTKLPKGQEVLLAAIHNDILRTYKSVSSSAGLQVDFYEIEVFSAIRATVEHGIAPLLMVDIGASTAKMYIVERGIVRLTHIVTAGGQNMTENLANTMTWEFEKAERVKRERGLIASTAYSRTENENISAALLSTLTRVFEEVNRVLLSYGERSNKNVARVILTGGAASLPGLVDVAKTSLNAEVIIANPFSHTEAPAFLDDVLRQIGPGFAVSIGLALRKLKHS